MKRGLRGRGAQRKEDRRSSLAKSSTLRGKSDCWIFWEAGGCGCAGGVGLCPICCDLIMFCSRWLTWDCWLCKSIFRRKLIPCGYTGWEQSGTYSVHGYINS